MPRARHISEALHTHLPGDYRAAASIIEASLVWPAPVAGGAMASFYYLPFTEFVAAYGLGERATSFRRHRVEALINGGALQLGHFDVVR